MDTFHINYTTQKGDKKRHSIQPVFQIKDQSFIKTNYFFCIKIPNTKRQKKLKSTKDCNGDLDLPCMNYGTKIQGLREIESKIQRTFHYYPSIHCYSSLWTQGGSLSLHAIQYTVHIVPQPACNRQYRHIVCIGPFKFL